MSRSFMVHANRRLLAVVLLLVLSCCRTPLKPTHFSYTTDIGIVVLGPGRACLQIRNASLSQNTEIDLVDPKIPQSTSTAIVIRQADNVCPANIGEPEVSRYEIRLAKDLPPSTMMAIVDPGVSFQRVGDLVTADLTHNGHQDFFRYCASSEGLHFTIWSGPSVESARLWHQYYYLGYDVEANCADRETLDLEQAK